MDQLVVLQEIYEAFSKGGEVLQSIDPKSIQGSCAGLLGELLEGSKVGKVEADVCIRLSDCLGDVYEVKRLGDICRKTGLPDVAVKCYHRAMNMTPDKGIRPVLLNNLGQVYASQGDISRAITFYKKASEGFEAVGDASGLAHVMGNLGSAYRKGNDWDKAVEYCYKGLKTFEKLGDKFGATQMMGSLGRIYSEMGERDLAALYYERSLKDFQLLGDMRSAAWVQNRLGKVYAEIGDWDSAVKEYQESLSTFGELGQDQSSGVVLSNLGKASLDKGDASAAKASLEEALKSMKREMVPAYQNAVACLAAAYIALANGCVEEADISSRARVVEKLKLASQYYARASDRYSELAATPRIDRPELKVAASLARSRSYMAKLHAEPGDAEAVALAERAISSLEVAASNLSVQEREKIEVAQRAMVGMKEVWSLGLIKGEPWKLTRSLADATEYLLGGASLGCFDEACGCISDALQGLRGALESEMRRADPSEKLAVVSGHLKSAQSRFSAMQGDLAAMSARKIGLALEHLSKLSSSSYQGAASSAQISDLLSYRAHRSILLLLGWVMVENALASVDIIGRIYAWDDSLNLVENRPAGQAVSKPKVGGRPAAEIAAAKEKDYSAELEGRAVEVEMEAISEDEGRYPVDDAVTMAEEPEIGWLVPVQSDIACTVQASRQKEAEMHRDTLEPGMERVFGYDCKQDRDKGGVYEVPLSVLGAEKAGWSYGAFMENLQKSMGSAWESFSDALGPAWESFSDALDEALSGSGAVKAVKAIAVVVLVLLAIDVILYLI